jgi:hypothetical protein
MKNISKIAFTAAAISLAAYASYATAQADSTTGSRALQGRPIVSLQNQERETPVINNTTQVTQQITQVIQPSISTASGSGSGFRFANAYASCGGGTLVGGGGSCQAANGYASMPTSQPNGNGWQVICDAFQGGNVDAYAWATCSN